MSLFVPSLRIAPAFSLNSHAVVYQGDCLKLLAAVPDNTIQLVVTSPPYNIGKSYERRNTLDVYVESQRQVITECVRVLKPGGSICWQVGNYVHDGAIIPLDCHLFQMLFKQWAITV